MHCILLHYSSLEVMTHRDAAMFGVKVKDVTKNSIYCFILVLL